MDERIARLKSSKESLAFAANAKRMGESDLEQEAIRKGRELQAVEEGFQTPAERAIGEALLTFEEEQGKLKGRKYRANRTRKMLKDHTPLIAAERMVLKARPSEGYRVLNETGNQGLSFEAILDRFPEEFSEEAVRAARARLAGESHSPKVATVPVEVRRVKPINADSMALRFLSEFSNSPPAHFRVQWLPGYKETSRVVASALQGHAYGSLFNLIWKTKDNFVANAGQGILGYEAAERLRDRLIGITKEIAEDPRPSNFDQIVSRMETWRDAGELHNVPRLLIARAFATLHPDRYHTTVDTAKQDAVIGWFVEHTGFSPPTETTWAWRAQSLVNHLSGLHSFNGDMLWRNMFPWFVYDQIRSAGSIVPDIPSYVRRPSSATAEIAARMSSVDLRHNDISHALWIRLVEEFGEASVFIEQATGAGTTADALVRHEDGSCFLYEIKVADTASRAVREAMGQLLEYAYGMNGFEPRKLYVVAEPALDRETATFLKRLRTDFNLELEYLQIERAAADSN